MQLPNSNMVVAYWLPSVGIGPATPGPGILPGKQTVVVPLTDVLNYTRPDGSPQINAIHLVGASFTDPGVFGPSSYLTFDPELVNVLTNGDVQKLQNAGVKVLLTIMGSNGNSVGWSTIPADAIEGFVNNLATSILSSTGYGLDGIDIDDEYAAWSQDDTLPQTAAAMRSAFGQNKLITKALFRDLEVIPGICKYLDYGGIMTYGNSASTLESIYAEYRNTGMQNNQLLMGVNAGPVAQWQGNFTSIQTTIELTKWQPGDGTKLGMMVWSFSQDIQQFTADPQNQEALQFPDSNDHQWQTTIINTMYGN